MTLAQTSTLLALAAGKRPYIMPNSRDIMLDAGWIVETGRVPHRNGGFVRQFAITDAGREALAKSEHRDHASKDMPMRQKGTWL